MNGIATETVLAVEDLCAGYGPIPVLFNLGRRCFNSQVGAVACLVYMFSPSMLERAFSGTPTSFIIFLTTAMLLSIHRLAAHVRDRGPEDPPRGPLVVTGLLAAALYLTEIKFILILPIVLGIVSWFFARSRGKALLACGLPVALLALPWMIRNAALGINPIFGLRSAEAFRYLHRCVGIFQPILCALSKIRRCNPWLCPCWSWPSRLEYAQCHTIPRRPSRGHPTRQNHERRR